MATAAEIVAQIDQALFDMAEEGFNRTVTVYGRSYTKQDVEQLKELRKFYSGIASQEELSTGGKAPFKMFGLRLGRPT